jgi:flagellar basal-body rod protein FlgB
MTGELVGGSTERALLVALDGLAVRQRVISSNVANIDTPGFKGAEVNFETRLKQALGRRDTLTMTTTDAGHLSADGLSMDEVVQVVPTNNTTLRNDGNNVDIDREMAKLAETSIAYDALSQLMASKLALWKTIINEVRR